MPLTDEELLNRGNISELSPEDQLKRAQLIIDRGIQLNRPSSADLSNIRLVQAYRDLIGRDPNAREFTQAIPAFGGADGDVTGRAFVAELAELEEQSPERLAERAPEFRPDVDRIFNDLLERGASPDEIDYFGRLLATGEVTPFEISQFVQQLPEFRQAEDAEFRQQLGGELNELTQEAFREASPQIVGQFARAGRTGSSALDFAITDLLGDLQRENRSFLANLSASQYGGRTGAARQDFLNNLGQIRGRLGQNELETRNLLGGLRARGFAGLDAERERQQFNEFLQSQRGGNRGLGRALGSLVGGIGGIAFTGNPAFGQAGAQAGGAGGQLLDEFVLNR